MERDVSDTLSPSRRHPSTFQRVPPDSFPKGVIDFHLTVSNLPLEYPYDCHSAAHISQHERSSKATKHTRLPEITAPANVNSEKHLHSISTSTSSSHAIPTTAHLSSQRPREISRSPSFPVTRQKSPVRSRPSSSSDHLQTSSSTGLSRAQSNPQPLKSPARRRPPASHSSYGIETSCGPPPSFITQRSRSQEKIWSLDRSKFVQSSRLVETDQNIFTDRISNAEPPTKTSAGTSEGATTGEESIHTRPSPDSVNVSSGLSQKNTMSLSPPMLDGSLDGSDRLNQPDEAEARMFSAGEDESKKTGSDDRRSEDLFLNIARSDAPPRAGLQSSRSERRRTRMSLPSLSIAQNIQSTSNKSPSHSTTPRSEMPQHTYNHYSSQTAHTTGRGYFDDTRSMVDERVSHRDNDFRTTARGTYVRQNSGTSQDVGYTPQRMATIKASRLGMDTSQEYQPRVPDHMATESTVSTTAPSTVWDELDDLKSRIRKLELTGKLPSSSAAAMTLADRPRTATTAATTISLSPKQNNVPITPRSMVDGISPAIHPLLHEALANAKTSVGPDVYHKLLATAQDALQLATMMNYDSYGGVSRLPSGTERQIRRRTESMCRSLTELTIALSAGSRPYASPPTGPYRHESSHAMGSGLRSRRLSNGSPDHAPVSYRTQSRLEGRRSTGSEMNGRHSHYSGEQAVNSSPIPFYDGQSYAARPSRMNTVTRQPLHRQQLDGTSDDPRDGDAEAASALRSFSRAATDVGVNRQTSRHGTTAARDYANRYPIAGQIDDNTVLNRSPTRVSSVSGLSIRRKQGPTAVPAGYQARTLGTPRENGLPSPAGAGSVTTVKTSMDGSNIERSSSRRILPAVSHRSTVNSRLRAVRAERDLMRRESLDAPSAGEMAQSGSEAELDLPRGELTNDM